MRSALLLVLAASHGVNDFLAGWLLGSETHRGLPWLVVYATLAFAGQVPAAWIVERARRPDRWVAAALLIMIVAVVVRPMSFACAIVASGVASALCHVAGGAVALQLPRRESAIGWFSAPGILGLTLGGWLGATHGALAAWTALLPVVLLGAWFALRRSWPAQIAAPRVAGAVFDAHDGLMLLLLLALTLRSALWDLVQVAQLHDPRMLLALAVSAAVGKVGGGWMAARLPHIRQLSLSLLGACLLLDLARWHVAFLCAGIALLQSTIPPAILALNRTFGTTPARATAYGLGLTVALGGLVTPVLPHVPSTLALVAAAALIVLWRAMRRGEAQPAGP